MSAFAPELLQTTVLAALAASPDGTIADSRALQVNGAQLSSTEDQTAIRAALDSLASKEVGHADCRAVTVLMRVDGHVPANHDDDARFDRGGQ